MRRHGGALYPGEDQWVAVEGERGARSGHVKTLTKQLRHAVAAAPSDTPAPVEEPPYFVAYSTVPQVLGAIRTRLAGHKIRLFVKERRFAYYQAK